MTAAVGLPVGRIPGSAAAGFSKFQGGFALIAVAYSLFMLLVGFTTDAGMQGGRFVRIRGFLDIPGRRLCIFWHVFTNRTMDVRYVRLREEII